MLVNKYYRTDEEFIYALAETMKPVYKAIADAGFLLNIDAPDIAYDWERESFENKNLSLEDGIGSSGACTSRRTITRWMVFLRIGFRACVLG